MNGVSFELQRGEVFGFLGPNCSGKTTTMRMALDLIRPDSGSVSLLGGVPHRRAMRRVGYLPEERGLFQRARVIDALRHLGRLKGLEAKAAEKRAEEMLRRVGLPDSMRATVQSLWRGMTQLIQFSGALLHEPDLIILDEPFAGLDPLNVELMKEMIRQEQARGASIIFSTHIMSDVEELCERMLLIDAGTTLLYGPLMELKRSRGTRTVKIAADRRPESVAGVIEPAAVDGHFEYKLTSGAEPQAILRSFRTPISRWSGSRWRCRRSTRSSLRRCAVRETASEARVVFSEELRRYIRRRSWLIVTGLVPALLLLLLVVVPIIRSIADSDEEPKPIGYVALSGDLSGASFPDFTRFDARQDGIDAITAGDIEDLFIAPADFLESGDVEWLSQRSGIFAGEDNRDRFASFLIVSLIAEKLEPSLLERVIAGADYVRVHVGEDGSITPEDDELNQFLAPLIFAVLLMMSIAVGSTTLLQSVSEEKENRMVDVLLTSVSPLALMTGKILALGTTSLIQIVVWITSIAIIGPQVIDQIPNAAELEIEPVTLVYVSLFFVAGFFLFSVVLAGIGSATTSAKEAGPISAMVVVPGAIPVWLSSVILSAPDAGIARLLSFIPLTAPTTMMMRIGSVEVSTAEILASLVVMVAAGVAMLFVSSRIFRAGMLLCGQRMTLAAVWRAVRQAG